MEVGEALGERVGRAGKVGIFPDVLVDGREMELIESATLLDTSKGGAVRVAEVLAKAVRSFVWRLPGEVLLDSISNVCLLELPRGKREGLNRDEVDQLVTRLSAG